MFKKYTVIKNDSNKHHEISYHCLKNRNSIGFVSFLFCDKASRKMIKRECFVFVFFFHSQFQGSLCYCMEGMKSGIWGRWSLVICFQEDERAEYLCSACFSFPFGLVPQHTPDGTFHLPHRSWKHRHTRGLSS